MAAGQRANNLVVAGHCADNSARFQSGLPGNGNGAKKTREDQSAAAVRTSASQIAAAARIHRARPRRAHRFGAISPRHIARRRSRSERAAQGLAHRVSRGDAHPRGQGPGAQPSACRHARERAGRLAPARSRRAVLGIFGRTRARGAARPVRAANHRRARRRGARRRAAQPETSRHHAARARCDGAAHTECRGGPPRRQGVSRGAARAPPRILSSCR